jgi:hypothetical protein
VLSPTQGQGCVNSANGIDQCYCGSSLTPAMCATATTQNGPCKTQELAGFAYTPGSMAANTIINEYLLSSQPSGNANYVVNCSAGNGCLCF